MNTIRPVETSAPISGTTPTKIVMDPHPLATPGTLPGVGNFARISPVLYRGEQPTAAGFDSLKNLGVKTIVCLRTFHGDRELLKGTGLQYFHIHAKPWHPEDEDVAAFLQIVQNPANQPVFVHCQHGADRTGYMVASYRMLEQNWTVDEAIAEMQNFGFHKFWTDIPAYLKRLNLVSLQEMIATAKKPVVNVVE